MKSFPMFIKTTGRRVIIVGGGEQAAQKARLVLKTDAQIVLVAPELDPELRGMVRQGRATQHSGQITPALFKNSALTFIATGCPVLDAGVHSLAKAGGAIVNVVDNPAMCDATTPSIVDRDPVVIAIGTEGTAPVLSRVVKTQIETILPLRLGHLAALAGRLRGAVAERIPANRRRAFWAWVFKGAPARLHQDGQEEKAVEIIKAELRDRNVADDVSAGHIALVGAGPGARDLLTMRAVQRLQEADVIYFDRLVDPEILELARRDAERVFVGKEVGASAWPQEKICALIVAEARKGRRVVRLKSGDPSIFGRATEELSAAKSANIAVEVVPGITAASAAAASLQHSLTERGQTDTLIFATGACQDGDSNPNWAEHARPGTTLAIYMGVRSAGEIANALIGRGAEPATPVEILSDVSTRKEQLIETDLQNLEHALADNAILGKAIILVRFPKTKAALLRHAA